MPHRTAAIAAIPDLMLARPRDGFTDVVVAGQALPAARLLGLVASSSAAPINTPPTESYVRGPDLIVAYEKPGQWPVRVDCLWRAMPSGAGDQFLAAVDLVVSVRTHALDSHPELAVSSAVPANEVFRLQSLAADRLGAAMPNDRGADDDGARQRHGLSAVSNAGPRS